MEKTWSRKQVSEITGLSDRRVLYYSERGMLLGLKKNVGSGTSREYSIFEIYDLLLIRELDRLGLSPSRMRGIIDSFHQTKDKWWLFDKFIDKPFLIIITLSDSDNEGFIFGYRIGSDVITTLADHISTIVINLTKLFKKAGI
jgi:DNA-binding transcriptional MerR regulator